MQTNWNIAAFEIFYVDELKYHFQIKTQFIKFCIGIRKGDTFIVYHLTHIIHTLVFLTIDLDVT